MLQWSEEYGLWVASQGRVITKKRASLLFSPKQWRQPSAELSF